VANHDQGDNFVRERTGSATMINLDGKWELVIDNNQLHKNNYNYFLGVLQCLYQIRTALPEGFK